MWIDRGLRLYRKTSRSLQPIWYNIGVHTHTLTDTECPVEYDGLLHRQLGRWANRPIFDKHILLSRRVALRHFQAVPVMLMVCCLRAASFLPSSTNHDSSNAMIADWHVVYHSARSSGAALSDLGRRLKPYLFILTFPCPRSAVVVFHDICSKKIFVLVSGVVLHAYDASNPVKLCFQQLRSLQCH